MILMTRRCRTGRWYECRCRRMDQSEIQQDARVQPTAVHSSADGIESAPAIVGRVAGGRGGGGGGSVCARGARSESRSEGLLRVLSLLGEASCRAAALAVSRGVGVLSQHSLTFLRATSGSELRRPRLASVQSNE